MKRGSIFVIILLLLIILGLVGYITYDKTVEARNQALANTNDRTTPKVDLIAMNQIDNTINRLDSAFNDKYTKYFGYIYKLEKQTRLKVEDFDKKAALYASLQGDLEKSNVIQYLIGGNVKSNYEKMFGSNLPYSAGNIEAGDGYRIVYNSAKDTYAYIAPLSTDYYGPQYKAFTTSVRVDDDRIIVTRKVYYAEYSIENNQATLYQDAEKEEEIGKLDLRDSTINDKEVNDKFSSKLKEFNYVFRMKRENEYNLYSVERIK